MSPKLKRIIAIVGLIFMAVFTVSLVTFLVNPSALDGRILYLTLISFGIGLLMFLLIYFTNGFPSQQNKDEEIKRLREEYLKKLEENKIENKDTNQEDESLDEDFTDKT